MGARSTCFGISFSLLALTLAACGGGGGGSSLPATPAVTSAGGSGLGSAATASVAFTIAIPSASTSSTKRSPRYISAGTKSVLIGYNANRQIVDCAQTCNVTLSVPPGSVTFQLGLYDGAGGTGNLLSSAKTTATILAGQGNSVALTFGGVVAKVSLALGAAGVTAGTPSTIPVTVSAKDAAGYTIVGSDPYDSPIALSVGGAGASLSTMSVSAPGAPVTLTYNGSTAVTAIDVSASAAGTGASAKQTLTVNSPPVSQPLGGAPAHETTWYYFGLNGVNASVPAAWMAAHADYVEDDGNTADHAEAFKDAGGKYAVSYTDPAYVPYCFAPFIGGSCRGQVGNLVSDESAWFHAADGTRVRRFVDSNFGYQEALNPASAAAQNAYRLTTQKILQSAPKIDYFFADDSGGVYIGDDGTQMSGWFYGFNAPAVEITSDAQFVPANRQMFAAAAKPLFVNGVNPANRQPSYNGAWIDSPNVAGQFYEGCYSDGSSVAGTRRNEWYLVSNSILTTIAHRTKAICMMTASATAANRIYELATWWLTYTEPYSVAMPAAPLADGLTVVPEFDIVPRQPLATATSDIAALRSSGGAYVREFAACYQGGTSIGPCAAVVNPSASSVAMPALTGHYTSALAVDDRSSYAGGTASWTGAVPAQLPSLGAVVLR